VIFIVRQSYRKLIFTHHGQKVVLISGTVQKLQQCICWKVIIHPPPPCCTLSKFNCWPETVNTKKDIFKKSVRNSHDRQLCSYNYDDLPPTQNVRMPTLVHLTTAANRNLAPSIYAPLHLKLAVGRGRLKTRNLTSRDWTTRHHIARVDIARLVSVFE